ncbi:MAG: methylenetetrahydrofolate--tRNA-(uracil-5-)-methyltransferase [Chloroflexota bacterium]|nr:methylenetetrahydrofolate--tRNA-(uracil-5-)-methyltransferase [Chloroflexota bacterium]
MEELIIIGGGLAGSEAAYQAAKRGIAVRLFEMRPAKSTPAHQTADLAEIVCSNSLGSLLRSRASGFLIAELQKMDSLLMACALESRIPAGKALAVDRSAFSRSMQARLEGLPNLEIVRKEVRRIPKQPTILASGPLTSPALARSLKRLTRQNNLFFYDAVAPIIAAESINMRVAYWGSRYGKGTKAGGDYINCPFNTMAEYKAFVHELLAAERIQLKHFERDIHKGVRGGKGRFFEACLPIEVMAERGMKTLSFGPLRPVGLRNPHTDSRPQAVVQLRQDNQSATLFNMVGFQTNLTYREQKRVFRLIPGLEQAEFVRYGQMHRNTYIYAPDVLQPTLQTKARPDLFIAGQIAGVEGYLGNIASGLLAGINAARYLQGQALLTLPPTSMLGALCGYITTPNPDHFQPMKVNFSLMPPLPGPLIKNKEERFLAQTERGLHDLSAYLGENHEEQYA